MATNRELIAHLYRRAGFGPTIDEIGPAERRGFDATLAQLMRGLHASDVDLAVQPPPLLDFYGDDHALGPVKSAEFLALTNWWIDLMASTTTPLKEKLVLLLHCQFPTGYSKVNIPSLMYRQNAIFRELGAGSYDKLSVAVAKDPAMLIWLDGDTNYVMHPNENFGREFMERFALGVGNYTEHDVKDSARAYTGWTINFNTGQQQFVPRLHDYTAKKIFGHDSDLTGEDVIRIVLGRPSAPRWIVSRFWSWLAYPVLPNDQVVSDLVPGFAENLNLGRLLGNIFTHPAFLSPESLQGLVKQPVEYVVGTLRTLKLSPANFPNGYVANTLTQLGQQLFNPPTVGGWGSNGYWLNTAASLTQLNFARTVAKVADHAFLDDEAPSQRPEALMHVLNTHPWSRPTLAALKQVQYDPPTLLTLGLVSPEYLAN